MIQIAFCDDDQTVLDQLSALLEKYRTQRCIQIQCTAFRSPLDLLAEIEKGVRYDILFLDVIMPAENGITVAKEIRQYDTAVEIIFLTSSTEFAVDQLKPIWEESFFRLTDSVIAECCRADQRSLVLRCKTGISRIELDRLLYCEVLGRTLLFHLSDGGVLESTGSMDELARQLAPYEIFLRPHRSFLVNMEYVQNISSRAVTLTNLVQIPIPHGKSSDIRRQYLEYAFRRKQVML